ncbi:MAG: type II toxin-antitoxin system RelE/ParE family toxin [Hyphomicrobiaceae bacterium]
MRVKVTSRAETDLDEIGERIAERNPLRAITFVQELRQRCSRIADLPHAGSPRPQWGEGIRIVVYGKYLIVYRVRDDAVQVLRIVHGARNLDTLFMKEPPPDN